MAYPNVAFSRSIQIQKPQSVDSFEVLEIVENPKEKTVVAKVRVGEHGIQFVELWKDDSYDEIGQFTDTDIQKTILTKLEPEIIAQEEIVKG